jgi:two-component system, NarL family, captular synthesis response regulator RcsB
MSTPIRVAIVEDHQSIIDGYIYRLSGPQVQIVAVARFGEEIETILADHGIDVLLLDIHVPTSTTNFNPFPVLVLLPNLLARYPRLKILVISMLNQRSLIEALVEIGISGYIFKEDYASIQQLAEVVQAVARGGIYFSQGAYQSLRASQKHLLTPRQMEALSLCATYPDSDISVLARRLDISPSTYRNLLSGAYARLGVQTRTAALSKAYQLGILTPATLSIPAPGGEDPDLA